MSHRVVRFEIRSLPAAAAVAFLLLLGLSGCNAQGYGDKVEYDGTEVYFLGDGVTQADADRLGAYLKSAGFTDGNRKSVQLQRAGDAWQFRMVTSDEAAKDPAFQAIAKLECLNLSGHVFDGAPVEFHICDDSLETQTTLKGLSGKLTPAGDSEIFHDGMESEQVERFVQFGQESGLLGETPLSIHLSKDGDVIVLRMVVVDPSDTSEEAMAPLKAIAEDISANVFDGAPVRVVACDDNFATVTTLEEVTGSATGGGKLR